MQSFNFGTYIYRSSLIHKISPVLKLLFFSTMVSFSIVANSYERLLGLSLVLLSFIILSKISLAEFYKSIAIFKWLFIFTLLVQLFFDSAGRFIFPPSFEMVEFALVSVYKFILAVAFSSIFILTTSPYEIAASIYFFIKPLKKFGVDTEKSAVSILVSLRFIPILFEEADKIMLAQRLRGVVKDGGTIKERLAFFTSAESFFVPLLVRVVRHAEMIFITLTYRKNLETALSLNKITRADFLFILTTLFLSLGLYAI